MYEVDQRVGCIAVIDTRLKDPDHNGLQIDDKHVVKFWAGEYNNSNWSISERQIQKATELCEVLNQEYQKASVSSRSRVEQDYDIKHKTINRFILETVWNGRTAEYLDDYPEDKYLFEHHRKLLEKAVDSMMFVWDTFKDTSCDKQFAEYVKDEKWSTFLFSARKAGGGSQPTDFMRGLDYYEIKKYMDRLN